MKLHTEENIVLSNSTSGEKAFTINATAKAFRILSDGLYSRKIEAIVRELSCNAYDSHVMAGKVDVPFTVCLPDEWASEFSVEDFGVGLDDQEIDSIYTSYFTSTKTDSNDVIGALGLGSKTPFAYTDAFNIRSRKNGVEYTYTAFISVKGEPTVTMIAKTETDEPNGVKISVPVKRQDYLEFRRSAELVYSYFKVKPDTNLELKYKDIDFEALDNDGYYINTYNGYSGTVFAIMGNVRYEVPSVTSTFGGDKLSDGSKMMLKHRQITVKFDIGDLDVAASRETISFDERTEEMFLKRVNSIGDVFLTGLQEKIDEVQGVVQKYNTAKERYGEWSLDYLTCADGKKLSAYKYEHAGEMIYDEINAVYKPLFVPQPVIDLTGNQVHDTNGNPVQTKYDIDTVVSGGVGWVNKNRYGSATTYGSLRHVGSTVPNYNTNKKIYVLEDTSGKASNMISKRFISEKSYSLGVAIVTHKPLDAAVKDRLNVVFGNLVTYVDLVKLCDEHQKKLADVRKARAADRVKNPPQPRIKKTEVRGCFISDNYVIGHDAYSNRVDINDVISKAKYYCTTKGHRMLLEHGETCTTRTMQSVSELLGEDIFVAKNKRDVDALEAAGMQSLDGVVEKHIKQNASSVEVYKFLLKHTKSKDCYVNSDIKELMQKTTDPIASVVLSKFDTKCPKLMEFVRATKNTQRSYDHTFPVRYSVQYDVMEPHRKKCDMMNEVIGRMMERAKKQVIGKDEIASFLYIHEKYDMMQQHLNMKKELADLKSEKVLANLI